MNVSHSLLAAAGPASDSPPWGVGWIAESLALAGLPAADLPWNAIWLAQLFIVCCAAFALLERLGTPVVEQERRGPFQPGWRADLVGAVVDGPLLGGLVEVVAVSLVLLVPSAGLTPGLDGWPVAAQFALLFLVTDFGRYWLHRWHHRSDLLWRLHRVHHSATRLGVLTTFRMHVLEVLPRHALLLLPFKALGVVPAAFLALTALDLVRNFWQHANVRLPVGWVNLVLSSSEQHWWHHAADRRGQRSNYGSALSVWDWLFGTIYWPRGEWPERVGVRGIDRFPESYLGRFVSPLLPEESFRGEASAGEDTSLPGRGSSGAGRSWLPAWLAVRRDIP